MRTLSALFILLFIFTLSSCDKWEEKEQDAYYYYSTDFKSENLKSGSITILNINIDDIDGIGHINHANKLDETLGRDGSPDQSSNIFFS